MSCCISYYFIHLASLEMQFSRTERTEPNPYCPHFVILLPTHFPYINIYIINTGFFCVCILFWLDAIFHNIASWKKKEKTHKNVL